MRLKEINQEEKSSWSFLENILVRADIHYPVTKFCRLVCLFVHIFFKCDYRCCRPAGSNATNGCFEEQGGLVLWCLNVTLFSCENRTVSSLILEQTAVRASGVSNPQLLEKLNSTQTEMAILPSFSSLQPSLLFRRTIRSNDFPPRLAGSQDITCSTEKTLSRLSLPWLSSAVRGCTIQRSAGGRRNMGFLLTPADLHFLNPFPTLAGPPQGIKEFSEERKGRGALPPCLPLAVTCNSLAKSAKDFQQHYRRRTLSHVSRKENKLVYILSLL
ncbi:hypothetical protein XENOCAPTIV_001345 [Xenoophorus captivus]|uniref:Uncharacterized protein n=1 Tax=Xenoophorus captivus TaxID=1517983 RepID=A0ABV0QZ21_9TELE